MILYMYDLGLYGDMNIDHSCTCIHTCTHVHTCTSVVPILGFACNSDTDIIGN